MDSQMTIAEYAKRRGVSVSTVRRRIKAGAIAARLVAGRYYIDADEQADSHVSNQDEHLNSQSDQGAEWSELVARLQSEVDYLRGQLDKQTSLLAITAQQNTALAKRLEPPPRESVAMRVRAKFASWKGAVLEGKPR